MTSSHRQTLVSAICEPCQLRLPPSEKGDFLPLPDIQAGHEDTYTLRHVASQGRIQVFKSLGPVSWRLLLDRRGIEIRSLELQNKPIAITLLSPAPINANTVGLSCFDKFLVVDFLTNVGMLHTVLVPWTPSPNEILESMPPSSWRSIKDMNGLGGQVQLMHVIPSSDRLLISLKNGNTVLVSRSPTDPLSNVTWERVDDDRPGLGIGLRFWGSDKIPGSDVSGRALLDLVSFYNDNMFITFSVSQTLKVYKDTKLLGETTFKQPTTHLSPARRLSMAQGSVSNLLAVYLPSSHEFRFFQINTKPDTGPVLVEYSVSSISVPSDPETNDVFSVLDFYVKEALNKIDHITVLLTGPSGLHVMRMDLLNVSNPHWEKLTQPERDYSPYFVQSILTSETNVHLKKLSRYLPQTLHSALSIYQAHFKIPPVQGSLKRQITATVGSMLQLEHPTDDAIHTFTRDMALQWQRFERLCHELERPCHKALAIAFVQGSFWVLQSAFLQTSRPCASLELLFLNKTDPAALRSLFPHQEQESVQQLGQIIDAAAKLTSIVPPSALSSTYAKIENDVFAQTQNTFKRVITIYESSLVGRISEPAIRALLTTFLQIGDAEAPMALLADLVLAPDRELDRHEYGHGLASELVTAATLQYAQFARSVLLDVGAMLIIVIANDSDGSAVGEVVYSLVLKALKAILQILDGLAVKSEFLGSPTDACAQVHDRLSVDKLVHIPRAMQFELGRLQSRELMITNPTVDLDIYLDPYNHVDCFIKAHSLITRGARHEALASFRSAGSYLSCTSLSQEESALVSLISPFYGQNNQQVFGNGLATYYHAVSCAIKDIDIQCALATAKLAVELSPDFDRSISEHLFHVAVGANDFDSAHNALADLAWPADSSSFTDLTNKVAKLVETMIISGQGSKLCNLPFVGTSNLLTEFLTRAAHKALYKSAVKQANNTSSIASPQVYCNLLYAWNIQHHRYRDAAMALYLLVQYCKLQLPVSDIPRAEHVIISETYLALLNALKCIRKPSDRYILTERVCEDSEPHEIRTRRSLVTYSDIESEYEKFVKHMNSILSSLV